MAYALVPVDGGPRMVAVELRKVRFEECGPGDGQRMQELPVEHRGQALKRLWKWISRRTMNDASDGWHSGAQIRGGR